MSTALDDSPAQIDPAFEAHARAIAARVYQLIHQSPKPLLPEYLSPDDACFFVGIKPRGLEKYRQPDWDGPPGPTVYKLGERQIRYKVQDLVDWMDSHAEGEG